MKYTAPSDGLRPLRLLEVALDREARLWKALTFKKGKIQGSDILASQQEDAVLWLEKHSKLLTLGPDTFALAVSILNRLLASVKAQPKYLRCIAITTLILASKVNEEEEVVMTVKGLALQSFSPAEIFRMERIILDKLHWDLYIATAVDFVYIFHALVLCGHPHLPRQHAQKKPCLQASLWTRQVQQCITCHQLSQFKGSTLALAIITLELETLTPDWFPVFTDLLKKAQVDSTELIRCKEMADEQLARFQFSEPSVVYIFDPSTVANSQSKSSDVTSGHLVASGLAERVKGVGNEEVYEFCDGFRCLYSEEITVEVEVEALTQSDVLQGHLFPCPPLQSPVN